MFAYEFCEISKNIFFTEHLWTTASVYLRNLCTMDVGILVEHNFYFLFLHQQNQQAQYFHKILKIHLWEKETLKDNSNEVTQLKYSFP